MGVPKAMLPFGPERLLQRLVRRLREAVEPVLVVALPGQELPSLPSEIRVVYDRAEGAAHWRDCTLGWQPSGAKRGRLRRRVRRPNAGAGFCNPHD